MVGPTHGPKSAQALDCTLVWPRLTEPLARPWLHLHLSLPVFFDSDFSLKFVFAFAGEAVPDVPR